LLSTLGKEEIRKSTPDALTPHCEECNRKYREEQEKLRKRVEIWNVLANSPSAKQLTKIVNADWPEDVYSKTKLVEERIFSTANYRDVIVLKGMQDIEEKSIIKAVINRQPHMEKSIMEVVKEGRIVYSSNTCLVSTESGTLREEVQRYTFIAGVDDRESGEEKADQCLVDTLQKLNGISKLRYLKRPSLSVVDLMTESRL
jgi:hypothetical protein